MVVIALQIALLVFRQYHDPAFGGLYKYRYIIYTLCVLFPGLMASLAFTNPKGGYIFLGAFCYLPREPIWYRLSLAVIPRGAVFSVILTLHSAIYLYTVGSLKEFMRVDAQSAQKFLGHGQANGKQDSHQAPMEFVTSCVTRKSEVEPTSVLPTRPPREESYPADTEKCNSHPDQEGSFAHTSAIPTQTFESEIASSGVSNVFHKREEIQHHVRLLLIYPLIYLGCWVFPMICQIVQFSKANEGGAVPFWMALVWGMILAAQPGLEALIVSARERPWRKKEKVSLSESRRVSNC
ncbi:hypothetical protein BP5796_10048 [Coleophoma crateriformis]|uniref:G protein-coupled receptor GPR1 C-terminal domain-containing protein n=1 Tax=Coleophoma crateriformis TaxID=565419 RepID=A0A3D8QU33_9HELO|nr:hypothetical protein BP5796_10048 [Coleophoma crateriformis]